MTTCLSLFSQSGSQKGIGEPQRVYGVWGVSQAIRGFFLQLSYQEKSGDTIKSMFMEFPFLEVLQTPSWNHMGSTRP